MTATSAARDAANRDEFFDAAQDAVGVRPSCSGRRRGRTVVRRRDIPISIPIADRFDRRHRWVQPNSRSARRAEAAMSHRHRLRAPDRAVPARRSSRARRASRVLVGGRALSRRCGARDATGWRGAHLRRPRGHRDHRRRGRAGIGPLQPRSHPPFRARQNQPSKTSFSNAGHRETRRPRPQPRASSESELMSSWVACACS